MNCIYSITSAHPEITKTYIGYTKCLKSRRAVHMTRCKKETKWPLYKYMNEHGVDKFDFKVLLELPAYDRALLRLLEKLYFNLHKPELNNHVPLRSPKTYLQDNAGKVQHYRLKNREKNNQLCKEKNAKNKDVIRERAKLYYYKNREKILEKSASMKQCACGAVVKHHAYKKHLESDEHRINLKNILEHTIQNKFSSLHHAQLDDTQN